MYTYTTGESPTPDESPFNLHKEFPDSTAVTQAWYSTEHQSLAVQARSGDVYQYINVPVSAWNRLVTATSPGREWNHLRHMYGPGSTSTTAPAVPEPPKAKEETNYYVTVNVDGSFEVGSSAEEIVEAIREVRESMDEKFSGTGLTFTITEVKFVN